MPRQDMAQLAQNNNYTDTGLPALLNYYQNATNELKELLTNDCEIILECKYCRALFRSILLFTSHKKNFCKGKFIAATANSLNVLNAVDEQRKHDEDEGDKEKEKKNSKSTDLVRLLNKKIQNVTVPVPGTKTVLNIATLPRFERQTRDAIIFDFAADLMGEKPIPPERTPIIFPTDPNIRAKVKMLRNTRSANPSKIQDKVTQEEINILARIINMYPTILEGMDMKCCISKCQDFLPFGNIYAFAFHCGMRHPKQEVDGKYSCFLCNFAGKTLNGFHNHLQKVHKQVKEDHEAYRFEDPERDVSLKKNRARSMSPITNQQEADKDLRIKSDEPPVIERVDIESNVNEENQAEEIDEPPPQLTRMVRRHRPMTLREDESRPDSRTETASNTSTDSVEEYEKEKKLKREVRAVMNRLMNEVEELMGERVDVSGVRLFGRKRKLRGRAAYLEKQKQLQSRMEKNSTPKKIAQLGEIKEEIKTEEMDEEKNIIPIELIQEEDHIVKKRKAETQLALSEIVDIDDINAPRPSRAKKRPDWMDNYHLEGGTKPLTPTKGSNETGLSTQAKNAFAPSSQRTKKSHSVASTKQTIMSALLANSDGDFILPDENILKNVIVKGVSSPGSSRRKQDMSMAKDPNEPGMIVVSNSNGRAEIPSDFGQIPVYLSSIERAVYFKGLRALPAENSSRELPYICEYCNERQPNLREGRRHMVGHVRIERLKCTLCGVGAFFCTDMRHHLLNKCCPKADLIPFAIKETIPCMTKEQADRLTEVVDLVQPGRVKFTTGRIVSSQSAVPYIPDKAIEEAILGDAVLPGREILYQDQPDHPYHKLKG